MTVATWPFGEETFYLVSGMNGESGRPDEVESDVEHRLWGGERDDRVVDQPMNPHRPDGHVEWWVGFGGVAATRRAGVVRERPLLLSAPGCAKAYTRLSSRNMFGRVRVILANATVVRSNTNSPSVPADGWSHINWPSGKSQTLSYSAVAL